MKSLSAKIALASGLTALVSSLAALVLAALCLIQLADMRGSARFEDDQGQARFTAGTFENGAPYLHLKGPDGGNVVVLDVMPDGSTRLVVRDQSGRSEIAIGATAEGPHVKATYDGETVWETPK